MVLFEFLYLNKLFAIFISAIVAFTPILDSEYETEKPANEYPIVMIHGLMGWGETDGFNKILPYWGTLSGDIPACMRKKGFEVYTANTGAMSSSWDQACELYAQLTGTRVDYGEAHSKEHGHARYGRTYTEKLCPEFGTYDENGNPNKIHLYGYSLGGTIARLFVSILEHGYPEEIEASDDVSDFFKGGKGEFVSSVSAVATPHKGTLCLNIEDSFFFEMVFKTIFFVWGNIGNSSLRSLWDIQLEQFGLTDVEEDGMEGFYSAEKAESIIYSRDCAYYDLTLKGAAEIAPKIKIVDDVYYFSYVSESVYVSERTGKIYPNFLMNPIMAIITAPRIIGFEEGEYDGVYVDESWYINDGCISTNTAKYPEGEPHKDFDPDSIEPGIWNVMPVVENMDHTDYMGIATNPFKTYSFYYDVFSVMYLV